VAVAKALVALLNPLLDSSSTMRNKLLVALPVALFTGLLAASAPASAASLTSVPSGWQVGTEPTWTSMYWYVPDGLPAGAPVIVLVHYCSGNAAGIFGEA